MIFELIYMISLGSPLFVFLDYHKRNNVHKAIIYVIVFYFAWKYVLSWLINNYGLYFAGSIPFLLFIFLLIGRKPIHKQKDAIDDVK